MAGAVGICWIELNHMDMILYVTHVKLGES